MKESFSLTLLVCLITLSKVIVQGTAENGRKEYLRMIILKLLGCSISTLEYVAEDSNMVTDSGYRCMTLQYLGYRVRWLSDWITLKLVAGKLWGEMAWGLDQSHKLVAKQL